jgi:hypothetical protein
MSLARCLKLWNGQGTNEQYNCHTLEKKRKAVCDFILKAKAIQVFLDITAVSYVRGKR